MKTDCMQDLPYRMVSVRERFGSDSSLTAPAFDERDDHVPDVDPAYRFNAEVTLAILAGFTCNRRVLVQGAAQRDDVRCRHAAALTQSSGERQSARRRGPGAQAAAMHG